MPTDDNVTGPDKPSLLSLLRREADAVRAADAAAREPLERAREEINRRLWDAFRWLNEVVGHLGVIRPTIARRFRLTDAVMIERPRFDHGFVAFRRQGLAQAEVIDHLEMHYRMAGSDPVVLRVGINAVPAVDERLRALMLKFHYQTEADERGVVRYGMFDIQPSISASVRLEPNYLRRVVNVTLRNVDRFESALLEFQPEGLDESAMEDLVRCVLGESDRFLLRAPLALIGPRRDKS